MKYPTLYGVYGVKVAQQIVVLFVWVRIPLITPKENCPSGRWGRFAKPLYDENCTVGSNPTFSAEARMVELVDTAVLEAVAEKLESSSLSLGTKTKLLIFKIKRYGIQTAI